MQNEDKSDEAAEALAAEAKATGGINQFMMPNYSPKYMFLMLAAGSYMDREPGHTESIMKFNANMLGIYDIDPFAPAR